MLPDSLALPVGLVQTRTNDTARKRRGAASELRAAVHLMEQGFDVYRCLAPHAPFDLVAHRDGQMYRVEVKTLGSSQWGTSGPVYPWPVNDEWDLLIICGEGVVFQFPASTSRDEARQMICDALGIRRQPRSETPQRKTISDAIEAFLHEYPGTSFEISEIYAGITARGWRLNPGTKASPYSVITQALYTMYNRGRIDRLRPGVYALPDRTVLESPQERQ